MADKKISQLTDGTSLQSGDFVVVARSGDNFKVDPTQFGSSIDVTGTVTSDGLTVETTQGDITIQNSASSLDFARAGNNYIRATDASGTFRFITGVSNFTTNRLEIDSNGDISFYEDTGTTPAFFWDASAESLGIGTTSPNAKLVVTDNSTKNMEIGWDSASSAMRILGFDRSSALNVPIEVRAQDIRFEIGAGGTGSEAMRINSSGNVGIGTSSPDGTLHVFAENNYNGTDFVDAPHALLDNGTITNHTAVLVFNSSGVSEANKKSGITGGNYFNELHGLGLFGDISGKDRSATPDVFINDSGNVGIGTSSPAYPLDVRTTVSTIAGFYGDNALLLVQNKSTGVLTLNGGGTGDSFAFETAGSEAMRITSSGILLVGTTDTTNTTLGCKIAVDGTTIVHTDASGFSQPLLLNRQDSDGTLLTFRQANSTVGSIGSESGVRSYIVLDPRTAGAGITAASSKIQPTNQTGSPTDATIDIGEGSYRWKDLYLSGGVYLGGTAAANLLDDYEEGTWTPEAADANTGGNTAAGYSQQYGWYVKIGNRVFVAWRLQGIDTTGMTAGNQIYIRGLPEAMANPSPSGQVFVGAASTANVVIDNGVNSFINANTLATGFRLSTSTGAGVFRNIIVSNLTSGTADIFGQFFYFV